MHAYQHVLVGLDLSDADAYLIAYAGYLAQAFPEINQITFCHNIRLDLPENVTHSRAKIRELLQQELEESIEAAADTLRPGLDTEIVVTDGQPTPQALAKVVRERKVDLVIGAKKTAGEGSGLVLEKLMRTSDFAASLLLVPNTAFHRFDKILVAVDFSRRSVRAIERALYWGGQTEASVEFAHVLSIPSRYFPYVPLRDTEPELEAEAGKEWRAFTRKHLPRLNEAPCACIFNHGQGVARRLKRYALEHHHDLLVLGTRGKGALTQMLVGSVALAVMKTGWHFPVLIVSDK